MNSRREFFFDANGECLWCSHSLHEHTIVDISDLTCDKCRKEDRPWLASGESIICWNLIDTALDDDLVQYRAES